MNPLDRYQAELKRPGFIHDPAQERAAVELHALYESLMQVHTRSPIQRWIDAIARLGTGPGTGVPGLYMWGGVGRGKTHLMDLFFGVLPFEQKLRMHFHRFMQRVHADLRELAGQKNPLELVGARVAREARVLCFDEFFVSDIADAMILSGLLESLTERGVTLVATSNVVPDQLYKGGLQRERFLPAIERIKHHMRIINIDGGIDHRLRLLEQAELYHSPLGQSAEASLLRSFVGLAPEPGIEGQSLEIEGRSLRSRRCADDVIWFDFPELCDGPRSQIDYIELSRIFHAVLISNVPVFSADHDDQARRFINLVDEFYDRNVKLVLSAAAPAHALYQGTRLVFEFQRTVSRLMEMQSREYLARPHRP